MLTLSAIGTGIAFLASHVWIFLVALLPSVLGFLSPVLSAVADGIKGFVGTVWQGAAEAKWPQWVLAATLAAVAGVVGYYYGWQACIDWIHAHFHLSTKALPSSWWKFW